MGDEYRDFWDNLAAMFHDDGSEIDEFARELSKAGTYLGASGIFAPEAGMVKALAADVGLIAHDVNGLGDIAAAQKN